MSFEYLSAYLSLMWNRIAPELGNHLWQSTLFAVLAAALTLALRKDQARARYWLWMAASLKFLIPFSLLVVLGGEFGWPSSAGGARPAVVFEQWIQVVAQPGTSFGWIPAILAVFWMCGAALVVLVWCGRWRKTSSQVRQSQLLRKGREVDALRSLSGNGAKLEIYLSKASMEPGIFGIFRPVLVWPERLSERLTDAEMATVVAHEVCHARRRDNLGAASHMLVEALFWFHPLVWWMGSRLIEERERACDEAVLGMGSNQHLYAESILKVCEFCVEAPLACVSGVTGSNLKKRIVHIMTDQAVRKLGMSKKLVLSVAGFLAIAAPITIGMFSATAGVAQSQDRSGPKDPTAPVHVRKDIMQNLIVKESKVPPKYPEEARKAGIQGVVTLKAIIGKAGDVESLDIVSGHPALAPAAIDAVEQWKYKPYILNGKAVEVETQVVVNFTLGT